jgi:O-antigen ligase
VLATRLRTAGPLAPILGVLAGWLAAFHARVALAALMAAVVAILVFVGAEMLLLGVVATEPWADMLQYPTSTLTIPKIVGLLAVAAWVLAAATRRAPLRYTPQIGWALAFVLVVVISLMLSHDPNAGLIKTISYALYATFLALFVQMIRGRERIERCLAIYAASATLAAAYGLIRFLSGEVGRAGGPLHDPNDFAFLLASAIPIAVYFALCWRRLRWLWLLAVPILVGASLATLSRGTIVGFAAVLVWAILSGRISMPGVLGGVVAAGVVAAVAFVFFQPLIQERLVQKSVVADKNVASRQVFWSAAWRMSLDNPVVGVGPGRFGAESQNYVLNDPIVLRNPVVHDSYLEILAEDGPFALGLFICFLASSWGALRSARRAALRIGDRDGRRLADALTASFVWTLVSAVFVSRQLSIPIWLIAGLAGSLALYWRELSQPPRLRELTPPQLALRRSYPGG